MMWWCGGCHGDKDDDDDDDDDKGLHNRTYFVC